MSIYDLPRDILPAQQDDGSGLIFHNYAAPAGAFSGRSILSRNAISLVISGEKTMHFAEKKVEVHDDEFHFLSTGNCLVTMQLNPAIQFRSVLLFFDTMVLTRFLLRYDKKVAQLRQQLQPAAEPYVAIKKDAFVRHYIASLQLLFASGRAISAEMKQLKFDELLLHLLETVPEQLLGFQYAKTEDFDDVAIRKAAENNITTNISLDELAFLCNTSLATFKRRFARIYGMPPGKWLLQRRMELARELLQNKNEKPGDVYHKLGYQDHSSFSQSFRQAYGLTPREYQAQQLSF